MTTPVGAGDGQPSWMAEAVDELVAETYDWLQEFLLEEFGVEIPDQKLTQDQLRAKFNDLAQQAEPQAWEQQYTALVEKVGQAEADRQMGLLIRRSPDQGAAPAPAPAAGGGQGQSQSYS